MSEKRKVVLVGWDAADWQLIHPLLDKGRMPNLQRLVETGVSGNLQTLKPALSPMLWTSIATGRHSADHAILGFFEPDPNTGTVRPASSTSRRVSAIWNILDAHGLAACTVNWFASHPAEPGRGTIVSNCIPTIASSVLQAPRNLPPGAVHPPSLTQTFTDLMVLPSDLSGDDLALFIPSLAKVDQEKDRRPLELAKLLAQTFTVHAAATWILEHTEWDFCGIYYDLIDRAGHHFMQLHPPRMAEASEEDFEIYRHVMNGVYECQDLLLGRLLQLAGPDATILLLSDHGFRSGEQRPLPQAGPEAWHRDHGVICVSGPGIRKDELVFGATLLDITPTLLALYGLPIAQDMPGRPLLEIFAEAPPLTSIPTYETGGARAAAEVLGESWDAVAMLDQLAALGYVDTRTDDQKQRAETIRADQSFNLARALMGGGRAEEAIPILEDLHRQKNEPRSALVLGLAYVRAKRIDDARALAATWPGAADDNEDRPLVNLLLAEIEIASGNGEAALPYLDAVRQAPSNRSHLLDGRIGRAMLLLQRWQDAEASFRAALAQWPDIGTLHRGLAASLWQQKRFRESAEAALESVSLDYQDAEGHFLLGRALAQIGQLPRAAQAFEVCLKLDGAHRRARAWLAAVEKRAAQTARG